MLCSCGAAKASLKPQLTYDIKTIEVAKIEVAKILLIKRVNPLFLVMGSSGLVMDAMVVAMHAVKYEERAGSVLDMCVSRFETTLMQSLSRQGFQASSSHKRYWDYFKPSQKHARESMGGLLRIRLKQLGFWSKATNDNYFPSVMVSAELIDPVSRVVLYSDRFSIGVDYTSVELMAVSSGNINMLPLADYSAGYESFNDLLDHPEKSRDDLLQAIDLAVRHIMRGLQRPKPAALLVFDPQLFKSMPPIPASFSVHMEEHSLQ